MCMRFRQSNILNGGVVWGKHVGYACNTDYMQVHVGYACGVLHASACGVCM